MRPEGGPGWPHGIPCEQRVEVTLGQPSPILKESVEPFPRSLDQVSGTDQTP